MVLIAVAQCDRPISILLAPLRCDPIIQTRVSENYANAIIFYNSPMKKKGTNPAGIPRASGERSSPTGNGTFSHNQVRPYPFYIFLSYLFIASYSLCMFWRLGRCFCDGSRALDEGDGSKFDSLTLLWPVKNAHARAAISAQHSALTEHTNHAALPPHHPSSFHP